MNSERQSRLSTVFIALLCGTALLATAGIFVAKHQKQVPARADRSFGLEDKDILLYMEAIAKIRQNAIFLKPDPSREEMVADSIRSYLTQKDPSSDYLNRDEYRRFKASQDDAYVGAGMEIKRERDGRILCMPYAGGPAAQAGINAGDELTKIDGAPVAGKSILAIASMARGKAGTQVEFLITTKRGTEKQVKVRRRAIAADSVAIDQLGTTRTVKMAFFSRDSKEKLKRILDTWHDDTPLILDLRHNAGGDLHAAIDSAMLFLARDKKVASIETRSGVKTYVANTEGENRASVPVYLWQDDGTASAAEVFIAALTQNDRAVSIGSKTFGKGTVQEIIELSDGSAVVLTTGLLKTPRGMVYDGEGLAPTYAVSGNSMMYVEKVAALSEREKAMKQ